MGAVLTGLLSAGAVRAQFGPFLIFSDPFNNETGVPLDHPITFTFSESMRTNHNIIWSANVMAANFNCVWTADDELTCTYRSNLPPNATITWTLDPTVFQNEAGETLFPINNSGSFTTSSGVAPTNCPGSEFGNFSITKTATYLQNSAAIPGLDPFAQPAFSGSANSPTTNPISSASVTLPGGAMKTLTNVFGGFFYHYEQFPTVAALDSAYPSGTYVARVQRSSGANQTANLNLPTSARPPVPHVSNFAEAQAINPAAPFTLRWDAFTGATAQSSLFLTIVSDTGVIIYPPPAPDPCNPPPGLPVTATSVTIPANSFPPGTNHTGYLSFHTATGVNSNAMPGIIASAGISQTTRFGLVTTGGGGQPTPPRFTQASRSGNDVQLQLTAPVNSTLVVEASPDFNAWTTVLTSNVMTGTVQFQEPATQPHRFYRARTQ